ncbi:MAG: monovalent cation/H+ antiporter subunit D family protein [Acidobacteria bacterium]|nr:MAG: monovalent cation/H+ antiporter subunit D family protein [Acidobacteriota bacterium]REK10558.1 MAG: monovalent cation/H+ antiporter subunit D family protein [Acidobacteriota bacterium]
MAAESVGQGLQQVALSTAFDVHFPALEVVLPLVAAPLCFLFRSRAFARILSAAVAWLTFGVALVLLQKVLAEGTVRYPLGGWAAPYGIEYRVTVAGAWVILVVSLVAALTLLFDSRGSASRLAPERRYLYYSAFLLCLAGLLGMAITGDLFNIFVFLEISSLSSYALIALGRDRRALMASYSYLIMGTIGGGFFMIGVGLLYQMTGTLNVEDMAQRLPAVLDTRTVLVGFAFLLVGLSIKLAVFPLHQWLPNAYTFAPPRVSAFLAGTATKVSYYVMAEVVFVLFGAHFVFTEIGLGAVLMPLSVAAMFVGSLAAIYQADLRRLLAYSSIGQLGYMTLGLSLANVEGLTSGLVHVFNHGVTKSGLFLVVACVGYRTGRTTVRSMAGLGTRMPATSLAFVIGGMSLIGVPGTAGFVSKWELIRGALAAERLWLAAVVLVSSLLAVVYVWRVVEMIYFGRPEGLESLGRDGEPVREAPFSMLLPTLILVAATVVFGLWSDPTLSVARSAAVELLGGAGG